ncbi:hypothetical protein chiPu_0001845 [Chiloscyllium punctatum]|uniref:Uncharacterized protein n=1 Tax=Chiloscyllium punctatum TaxID=137246 RepID=A0A401RZA6_CHIPU|nr:hypothetical protein [Chiloscyllium punctatum]
MSREWALTLKVLFIKDIIGYNKNGTVGEPIYLLSAEQKLLSYWQTWYYLSHKLKHCPMNEDKGSKFRVAHLFLVFSVVSDQL